MIDVLVITFCLSAQCQEQRFPIDQPVQCQTGIAAQVIAQQWIDEHPGYSVKRWRCERGDLL